MEKHSGTQTKPSYLSTTYRRRRRRKRKQQLFIGTVLILSMVCIGWLMGKGIRILQTLLQNDGIYTIALDAGHGGGDVGAVGVIQEIEMTQQTVDALYQLLDDDPNYEPIHTRDNYDVRAKPSERAVQATKKQAELLLSVHGNAALDDTVRGFECYPAVPGRKNHKESLKFAKNVAAQMHQLGATLRGSAGIRYAYYSGEEKTIVDGSDDRVRSLDSFTILEQSKCPAVLIEQCFITSAEDVAEYAGEDGCARCAEAYYRAICEYFGTKPFPQQD